MNKSECVCVCIYIYIYIYTHTHTHNTHVYVCVWVSICTYVSTNLVQGMTLTWIQWWGSRSRALEIWVPLHCHYSQVHSDPESSRVLSIDQIELFKVDKPMIKIQTYDTLWGQMYMPSCTFSGSVWAMRCWSCLGPSLHAQHLFRRWEGHANNWQTLLHSVKHTHTGRMSSRIKGPTNIHQPSNMEYKNNAEQSQLKQIKKEEHQNIYRAPKIKHWHYSSGWGQIHWKWPYQKKDRLHLPLELENFNRQKWIWCGFCSQEWSSA